MTPDEFYERHADRMQRIGACLVWTGAHFTHGYAAVRFDGRPQPAHRIVYAFAHGPIPAGIMIDHICHNRSCIELSHLRPATNAQNGRYRKGARPDSASGIRGVYWDRRRNKYQTYCKVAGLQRFLGYYADLSDAVAAVEAGRALHYGEFAGKG